MSRAHPRQQVADLRNPRTRVPRAGHAGRRSEVADGLHEEGARRVHVRHYAGVGGMTAMRMRRGIHVVVTSSVALLVLSVLVFAQRPAAPPATRDISGFWALSFDSRKVPTAKLLPRVTRAMLDLHARRDVHAIRWCNLLGVPAIMDSGSPLDIRQGTTTIVIAPENNIAPRYVYLNRKHVDPNI